ncbi:beta-alanine transporter-like [Ornithodoros turicata]|uniref:beta-alanine transporter-like n=1 Tax=Ornithodoros turicata TaxID=34597 RepID=UPI003138EB96
MEDYDCAQLYGYGRQQRRVLCCTQLSGAVFVLHAFAMRLLVADVDYWCVTPEYGSFFNITPGDWKNMNIPIINGSYSRCQMYDPPLTNVTSDVTRAIVNCTSWEYDLGEGVRTILSEWNLVCGRAWLVQLATTLFFVGRITGVVVTGHVVDRVGRKPVIYVSTFMTVASAVGVTFSLSFRIFVVTRMVLAASLSALKIATFVLLFELTPLDHRNCYCCLAHCGALICLGVVHTLDGVVLDMMTTFMILLWPTSFLIYNLYVVEESPQWLFTTNSIRSLERAVRSTCFYNDYPFSSQKVRAEFDAQKHECMRRGETPGRRMTFVQLVTNRQTRQRVLVLSSTWFVIEFVMYGTAFHFRQRDTLLLHLYVIAVQGLALASLICAMRSYGRRQIIGMCLYVAVAGCSCLCVTTTVYFVLYQLLRFITVMSTFVALVVTYVYCAELHPAAFRGAGISCCYLCGRLGSFAAVLFEVLPRWTHPGIPFAIGVALILTSLMLLRDLPDTPRLTDRVGGTVPENKMCARGLADFKRRPW